MDKTGRKVTKHQWYIPKSEDIVRDKEGLERVQLQVVRCRRCLEPKRHGLNPPCFGRPYIIKDGKAY